MIIGLTGGIGTGKSTVSKMMRGHDWVVVDADVIARQVVEPHEPAFEAIVNAFGDDIVSEETGTINREKLGRLVFGDEEKRERLNRIVHPAVREAMIMEAEEAKDYGAEVVVMDIPLLIESDLFHMVERTVLVYAPEEKQIERVMDRNGLTEDEVRARLRAQLPIEEKKQKVDDVIDNSGTLEDLEAEVAAYVETIHNLLA